MEQHRKVPVDDAHRVEIRWAKEEDIPWVETELLEFSEAIGTKYPLFPLDADFRRDTLVKLMNDHLFLIAEKAGTPVGLISGVMIPHLLNPAVTVLHELFWWVNPKYRGTRAGLMLLEDFVEWGKQHCQWVYFSVHRTTEVSKRAMIRQGFREEQTVFLLEV
jgi:RimJ/RimL family protein N-acetyltransferase